MSQTKISRKVVESYQRYKDRKIAFLDDSDINALSLNQQQDCIVITGKYKASAWGYPKIPNSYTQDGIGIDMSMRNAIDVALGDSVFIEKVVPVAGNNVTMKPIEEIIPGISTRVAEYIPFALKDNPLVVGERTRYTFDDTTFVFEVVDVQPVTTGAVVVTKNTKFRIGSS